MLILYRVTNKKEKPLKVCICTLGKNENRYIREFVQYYKEIGVDKIFLYDNNNINDEKFEEIISDYLNKKLVKIFNWRGKHKAQFHIYKDCYFKYNKIFDWFIFYDIDEYIYLKNYSNIKEFLKESKFNHCNKIYLNWVIHTDNNLLKYDNRTLHKRFPQIQQTKNNYIGTGKSILRGGILKIKIYDPHLIDRNIESCNGFGQKIRFINNGFYMKNIDFEYYYIDHYYSKSLEEFIEKLNRGDACFQKEKAFIYHKINRYFKFNKITIEKIKYLEKKVGVNLSIYKKRIFNNKY